MCGSTGGAPCSGCAARLRPAPDLPVPPGLDALVAVLAYQGAGRQLVARLKYRNQRSALPALADAMAAGVRARIGAGRIDVVGWAPTTGRRRRERGFDQAELLARALARRLGVRCRPLLDRLDGPAQTGRHRRDRWEGPGFRARRGVPARVCLVDDVVTTGATMAAAATALRHAGATCVIGVAAARTPPRGGLKPARRGSDLGGDDAGAADGRAPG